ncbi:signal recognition particle subunit [Xylographa soralifera]|nr:signal recognition particle subunit [Xylographa soralifera]
MSLNPRIEEVPSSSSSSSASDPSDMDPSDYMRPTSSLPPTRIHHLSPATAPHAQPQIPTEPPPPPAAQLQPHFRSQTTPTTPSLDPARYKDWQSLYPVYFDASRSRAEGRRVGRALAVASPLARTLADAAGALGLQVVLEVGKTHPRDWANPGRVKVGLKTSGGAGVGVKNSKWRLPWLRGVGGVDRERDTGRWLWLQQGLSHGLTHAALRTEHHLYILIARYLQAHPTTPDDPFRAGMRIAGMPLPERPLPLPAKPRGWKIGDVLPLHSPAVSGGGVSENMFKDMMQEMGGGAGLGVGEGPAAGGGAEGKVKKVKRKVIRA